GPPLGAAEERADRGDDLAEVVVQLTRHRSLQILLQAQRVPGERPKLLADDAHFLERPTGLYDDTPARGRKQDDLDAGERTHVAGHAIVDAAVGRRGQLLRVNVRDEELRDHRVQLALLADGAMQEADGGFVFPGHRAGEDAVDAAPERGNRAFEPGLLRGFAIGRRQRTL